jgi:hypothetical protein
MKRGKRRSLIWFIPPEEFQNLLNTSDSFVDLLRQIDLDPYNGNHKTLHQRIKEERFDTSLLEKMRGEKMKKHMRLMAEKASYSLDDILSENSSYSRTSLKRRLVENGLLDYCCKHCKNPGLWNGKELSLHLDHINGVNNDNRLENLRFLCPNCHSQTDTYSGKRNKKDNHCIDCGACVFKKSERCKECFYKLRSKNTRKFHVSAEELTELIEKLPMTKVGEMFGVSDNAIRKRCKVLGIALPNRKTQT